MSISLLGDSVLDNFYWLQNPKHDLKYELEQLNYNVNNFAVDESELNDIIDGKVPSDIYKNKRDYPYNCEKDGKLYPIKLLSNTNTDMTVLSIGGNDFRVKLWALFLGTDYFINSVLTPEFTAKFDSILKDIKTHSSKVILINVYLPYLGSGSTYAVFSKHKQLFSQRLTLFYKELANKHNVAVLDLMRTFDSNNRSHYGSTEIEPSNLSNKCMADCIDYIYNNYTGYSIYWAPNCDINNIKVESAYTSISTSGSNSNGGGCPVQ